MSLLYIWFHIVPFRREEMDSTNDEGQRNNKDSAGKSKAERVWKGWSLLLLLSEAIKHLYIASLSASPAYSEDFEEEASEKSDEVPREKVNIHFEATLTLWNEPCLVNSVQCLVNVLKLLNSGVSYLEMHGYKCRSIFAFCDILSLY